MLSEEEKRELKEMAASRAVREEFRKLCPPRRMEIDDYIRFLSMFSRYCPSESRPLPKEYERVLL